MKPCRQVFTTQLTQVPRVVWLVLNAQAVPNLEEPSVLPEVLERSTLVTYLHHGLG